MGTDIHMYVERKEGGEWRGVNPPKPPGRILKASLKNDEKLSDEDWDHVGFDWRYHKDAGLLVSWNIDRHYDLFAVLADVRNGSGFAGVDTGDGFVPISPPRGLPDDMSPVMAKTAIELLEHTPTWLLLSDLKLYAANQLQTRSTKARGVVNPVQFQEWKENGRPSSWCGGVSGPFVTHIDHTRMDELIRSDSAVLTAQKDFQQPSFYTQVEWPVTYKEAVGEWFDKWIPMLETIGADNDVRLVFWFDS